MAAIFGMAIGGYAYYVKPLESSRPGPADIPEKLSLGGQAVDARLWQDPLEAAALAIREQEGSDVPSQERGTPGPFTTLGDMLRQVSKARCSGTTGVLVLPVMVPGGPYSEEAEVRHRLRVATVAALAESSYFPVNQEHIGVIRIPWPGKEQLEPNLCHATAESGTTTQCDISRWTSAAVAPSRTRPQEQPTTKTAATNSGLPAARTATPPTQVVAGSLPAARLNLVLPFEWYEPQSNTASIASRTDAHAPPAVLVLWLNEDLFMDRPLLRFSLLKRILSTTCSHDTAAEQTAAEQKVPGLHLLRISLLKRFLSTTCSHDTAAKREVPGLHPVRWLIQGPATSTALKSLLSGFEAHEAPCKLLQVALQDTRFACSRATQDMDQLFDLKPLCLDTNKGSAGQISRTEDKSTLRLHFSDTESLDIHRMNAPDSELMKTALQELERRRIRPKDELVNAFDLVGITELDSVYGRGFKATLEEGLKQVRVPEAVLKLEALNGYFPSTHQDSRGLRYIPVFHYLRGIDGRTSRSRREYLSGRLEATGESNLSIPSMPSRFPEEAEGFVQYDYLRRLATNLGRKDGLVRGRNGIGIRSAMVFGSDAHDKLLILQAIRPVLPGALFLTTDLDARLFGPRYQDVTRNLVVISGFGLRLKWSYQHAPPFRDSYQTALFYALRSSLPLTANREHPNKRERPGLLWELSTGRSTLTSSMSPLFPKPLVYEIGNRGPVLMTTDAEKTWSMVDDERPSDRAQEELQNYPTFALLALSTTTLLLVVAAILGGLVLPEPARPDTVDGSAHRTLMRTLAGLTAVVAVTAVTLCFLWEIFPIRSKDAAAATAAWKLPTQSSATQGTDCNGRAQIEERARTLGMTWSALSALGLLLIICSPRARGRRHARLVAYASAGWLFVTVVSILVNIDKQTIQVPQLQGVLLASIAVMFSLIALLARVLHLLRLPSQTRGKHFSLDLRSWVPGTFLGKLLLIYLLYVLTWLIVEGFPTTGRSPMALVSVVMIAALSWWLLASRSGTSRLGRSRSFLAVMVLTLGSLVSLRLGPWTALLAAIPLWFYLAALSEIEFKPPDLNGTNTWVQKSSIILCGGACGLMFFYCYGASISYDQSGSQSNALFQGVGQWELMAARLAIFFLNLWFIYRVFSVLSSTPQKFQQREEYFDSGPLSRPPGENDEAFRVTWMRYCQENGSLRLFGYSVVHSLFFFLGLLVAFRWFGWPQFSGRAGQFWWACYSAIVIGSGALTVFLTFLVYDATVVLSRFALRLSETATVWETEVIDRWIRRDSGLAESDRFFSEYLDLRVIEELSDKLAKLVYYPMISTALWLVIRSPYLGANHEHWPLALRLAPVMLIAFTLHCFVTLNRIGSEMRDRNLRELQRAMTRARFRDNRRLFESLQLIAEESRSLERGAFASLTNHPLFSSSLLTAGSLGIWPIVELIVRLSSTY